MDRRSFLAVASTTVGTVSAGCLDDDTDIGTERVAVGSAESSGVTVDNGSIVEADGGTLRVTATQLRRSIIAPRQNNRVYEPEDGQFLRVSISANRIQSDDIGSNLVLETNGETAVSGTEIPTAIAITENSEEVGLGMPIGTAESASVRFTRGISPSWRVPEELVSSFDVAPEFHLTSADIGEQNGKTNLELAVENRGSRDGIFRCTTASRGEGRPEPVRFTVGAGETLTVSISNETISEWSPDNSFIHEVDANTRAFIADSDKS
ncbi:hypothetical protein ACFQJ7_02790 [Halovenus rubra]|uniref:Uncharacterized protein n=2 Tax=Halovenus rubra TaxID=869890 RepID=A0ACC7E2I6_9EURY|nr:hypothetical protein [Halovenus rubra]